MRFIVSQMSNDEFWGNQQGAHHKGRHWRPAWYGVGLRPVDSFGRHLRNGLAKHCVFQSCWRKKNTHDMMKEKNLSHQHRSMSSSPKTKVFQHSSATARRCLCDSCGRHIDSVDQTLFSSCDLWYKGFTPAINTAYLQIILSKVIFKVSLNIQNITLVYRYTCIPFYSKFVNSILLLWISNRY